MPMLSALGSQLSASGYLLLASIAWLCPVPASCAPRIESVRMDTPTVARHGRFEAGAQITGSWDNPFDPDQIDVMAEIETPSGKTVRTPAFWHQEYVERAPSAPVRRAMAMVTLFAYDRDWAAGTRCESFMDDIALMDGQGREIPYDDMEAGDTPRLEALDAPPLEFATSLRHAGKRSLRFAPEFRGTTRWPSVLFRLNGADWTRYRGMAMWVYPRCDTPIGPLRVYYTDREWGKSRDGAFEPRNGTLIANRWNKLVWRWVDPWPPVALTAEGAPEWRVRFTPTEVGEHRFRLVARDRTGETVSEVARFRAAPSASRGFVRASKDDARYFAFDDGTPFVPIGHDVPLGLPDVRACYPQMKAQGENATYFVLCPYDLSF